MILLTHPAQIYQVDSKNKDLGKSYMIQDKVFKILQLKVGVAKYCVCVTRVSMRCPKFRLPIGVIVFDELELISFVSQGLTLSTASLVFTRIRSSMLKQRIYLDLEYYCCKVKWWCVI